MPDETRSCFLHGDYTGKAECPGCRQKIRLDDADHCACLHDGRGTLMAECQEHHTIREQRAVLLTALKAIVEHEQIDGTGIRYVFDWHSPLGQQARAAIAKVEA